MAPTTMLSLATWVLRTPRMVFGGYAKGRSLSLRKVPNPIRPAGMCCVALWFLPMVQVGHSFPRCLRTAEEGVPFLGQRAESRVPYRLTTRCSRPPGRLASLSNSALALTPAAAELGFVRPTEIMTLSHCPVCGVPFPEPEHIDSVRSSWDICVCCGCEYGLDDTPEYRAKWLQRGSPWFTREREPGNWDLREQLTHIIPDWDHGYGEGFPPRTPSPPA